MNKYNQKKKKQTHKFREQRREGSGEEQNRVGD